MRWERGGEKKVYSVVRMERVVAPCLASQNENYAIFGTRNMKTLKNMLHTVCVLCVRVRVHVCCLSVLREHTTQ